MFPGPGELLGRSRGPESDAVHRANQVQRREADAAPDRVNENPPARPETAEPEQSIVRGHESLGNRGRLGEPDPRRNARERALVSDDVLGVGTSPDETED